MSPRKKPAPRSTLSIERATIRLLAAAIAGSATALWLVPSGTGWWFRGLAGWDAASLVLCLFAWHIILRADASETRRRAGVDDPGHRPVFFIAIVSSLVSLFAAGAALRMVKALPPGSQAIWTTLALSAIVLSWALTHTSYTLRYAHLYYRGGEAADGKDCLAFPGAAPPADIDFAYVAFTIGMTFQVSDVQVTSSEMRSEVLVHSLLSFVYNTTILALALNMIMGLLS